jgi:glucosamine--fructose-6-phosphate aminotransferase (isomerizing)
MSQYEPDTLYVARRGSPIVIGVGKEQNIIASDATVIGEYTDKVIFLEDDQIAKVTAHSVDVYDVKLRQQTPDIATLEEGEIQAELGRFSSFLEKEILEQPESLYNVMRGRVDQNGTIKLGGPNLSAQDIASIKQLLIIGCGTSYYSGLYARYKLEEMLGIPVSVEHASEFRYRYGAYDTERTLAIFMSQSGETADVLASLHEAKRRHIKTMGIVNTVGSSVARAVEYGGIYLHAGQEVSVASTKAYSSMVVALLMFGAQLVYQSGGNSNITKQVAHELLALPNEFSSAFHLRDQLRKIVPKLVAFTTWFYLGRNELYPVALEGALKLTEISYIHAQAFPSGEMKHGPISLIDENHLSVLLLPEDPLLYEKGISALEEIKARGGHVFSISTRPKPNGSDFHLQIAYTGEYTDGLVYNVCLQLLALEVAETKGVNIDKPRNLAKSVTVE